MVMFLVVVTLTFTNPNHLLLIISTHPTLDQLSPRVNGTTKANFLPSGSMLMIIPMVSKMNHSGDIGTKTEKNFEIVKIQSVLKFTTRIHSSHMKTLLMKMLMVSHKLTLLTLSVVSNAKIVHKQLIQKLVPKLSLAQIPKYDIDVFQVLTK